MQNFWPKDKTWTFRLYFGGNAKTSPAKYQSCILAKNLRDIGELRFLCCQVMFYSGKSTFTYNASGNLPKLFVTITDET